MTDISKAQIGEEERRKLDKMGRSLRLEIEKLLDDGLPISTRIEAMKAAGCSICGFVDDRVKLVVFPLVAADYLKGLISIAKQSTSENDVYLVLRHIDDAPVNFQGTVQTYAILADPYVSQVYAFTIETFIKFRTKFDIVKMCNSILDGLFDPALASYPECTKMFEASGLIPVLANMITTHSMYEADVGENENAAGASNEGSIGALALNILKTALEYYNLVKLPKSILVEAAFPVFHCVLNSNDCKILDIGGGVISEFLKGAGKQTLSLRFTNGKTGQQYVLLVAAHILNRSNGCRGKERFPEYVVLSMIEELEETLEGEYELGESLHVLLKVLLYMLRHCAGEPKTTEPLLLIFSHLIQIDCKAVINVLSVSAGTSSQTSLRTMVVDGLCRKYESLAKWNRKTAKLALEKIYGYGVAHPESQLHEESFEAVRALLLSLNVGDVEEVEILADHAEVDVRT